MKLMKMAGAVRTCGKGSVRRKKAVRKTTTTNDMKMAGGKGSFTRKKKKKKKAVHKTDDKRPLRRTGVTTIPATEEVKDETVLNPKGNGNPSLGSASQKPADDEDIAAADDEWGTWGCHNHDLCIEANREPVLYPPFWEILTSYDEDDDDDPGPSIREDENPLEDLLKALVYD